MSLAAAAPAAAGDIAAKYVEEIEELVADNSLSEAFLRLQDFTRDFLPSLKAKVLVLRSRHSAWRIDTGSGLTPSDNINDIRAAILDLSNRIFEEVHNEAAPEAEPVAAEGVAAAKATGGNKVHLIVDNDREEPVLAEMPPGQQNPSPDQVTLDELRRQYFRTQWKSDTSVACDCREVSKKYKRGDFTLHSTSVQLRVGEITAVVGINASGKTTLLRVLMGDLKPDSGSVDFPHLGQTSWYNIKSEIAFIPQLPEKWFGRLRHNLNYVAAAHAKPGQDVRQLVDWNIARFGMQRYEDATWDEISGGYKIRFELVRALVSQPKILILDEPLAYLDVIASQHFLADLKTIASSLEQPIPVVVSSQHLHEIETVADQIILLDNGVCKYSGALEGVASLMEDRLVEISLDVTRARLEEVLLPTGLKRAERTMGGYILSYPKSADMGEVMQALYRAFGPKFKAFRDLSGSARGLMGN